MHYIIDKFSLFSMRIHKLNKGINYIDLFLSTITIINNVNLLN